MFKSRRLLIIGLGNPGSEYKNTRHNAGFMAIDFLAGSGAKWKSEKNFVVAKGKTSIKLANELTGKAWDNGHAYFIKPQTYMNLSGLAVMAAMQKYKIPLTDIIVIHDDLDIQLGDIRIKTGGANAGHNGLKSISAAVGNDYRRIRIGIGRPITMPTECQNKHNEIINWVLGRFTTTEKIAIFKVIESMCAN